MVVSVLDEWVSSSLILKLLLKMLAQCDPNTFTGYDVKTAIALPQN